MTSRVGTRLVGLEHHQGDLFSPLPMQVPDVCLLQDKQINVLAVVLFSASKIFPCFFSRAEAFMVHTVYLGTATVGFNLTDSSVC